jgi:predicted nucleic acid-binding protein
MGQVEHLARSYRVLDLTPQIVLEAVRGVRDQRLAYWDAQIWATARLNQVPTVFSEDFRPGTTLEGVRFVNPFVAEFDLAQWL